MPAHVLISDDDRTPRAGSARSIDGGVEQRRSGN